jgi:hypothetical protein
MAELRGENKKAADWALAAPADKIVRDTYAE